MDSSPKGLLPAGLQDILPPDSAFEARVIERLLACFAGWGYERVKPPLVEFEENLLAGAGAALANEIFRVMDPVSQRMMGVRADMTMQVARIARTRLVRAPRPLRLSYAGEVLRVRGGELSSERAFAQVGLELIGSVAASADAEVILLAAEALSAVGLERLSIDFSAPPLVPALCAGLGLDAETAARARDALDRKDAAAVEALGGRAAGPLGALLGAVGPARPALDVIARLELPEEARRGAEELGEVAGRVLAGRPDLHLTIDPVEHRGFEYHTGVSFSIFALGQRGELGRGGRYRVGDGDEGEPATGGTLFMQRVLRALARPGPEPRVFLPFGTPVKVAQKLRAEGWITVVGLEPAADSLAEARRMRCSHHWADGEARPMTGAAEA